MPWKHGLPSQPSKTHQGYSQQMLGRRWQLILRSHELLNHKSRGATHHGCIFTVTTLKLEQEALLCTDSSFQGSFQGVWNQPARFSRLKAAKGQVNFLDVALGIKDCWIQIIFCTWIYFLHNKIAWCGISIFKTPVRCDVRQAECEDTPHRLPHCSSMPSFGYVAFHCSHLRDLIQG